MDEDSVRASGPLVLAGVVPVSTAACESDDPTVLSENIVERAAANGDLETLTTLGGDELTVSIESGQVRIDGALVQTADVAASNGVIHVIDAVLLPN